jgi:prepilin-type N-terminal cleavage/methylation domain-containing protein
MIKNKKGVTIVEIAVAIIIVGILTAIWMVNRDKQINAAIAQEGRAAVEEILSRQRTYYANHGAFLIVGNTDVDPTLGVDLRKHSYFNRFDAFMDGTSVRVTVTGPNARGVVVKGVYSPVDNRISIQEEI